MGFDKLWAIVGGRPLLAWPLLTFSEVPGIDQIILVVSAENLEGAESLVSELGLSACVVVGGATRRASVEAGLRMIGAEWVVVHDAARPCLTVDLIRTGLEAARATGAAIAGVPVTDTVKQVQDGTIQRTLDRSALWSAQTPQVFQTELLRRAHRSGEETVTDDATLVEALGVEVRVYEGAYANIKVTMPVDLQLATLLLSER